MSSGFEERKKELRDKGKDELVKEVMDLEYDAAMRGAYKEAEEETEFFKRLKEDEKNFLESKFGTMLASNLTSFSTELIKNFHDCFREQEVSLNFLKDYRSSLFSYDLMKLVFKYGEQVKPEYVLIRYPGDEKNYPIHFVFINKEKENVGEFVVAPRTRTGFEELSEIIEATNKNKEKKQRIKE